MKKIPFIILLSILALFILIGIFSLLSTQNSATGKAIKDSYSFTKAICNETNYCEDYEVVCKNKEIIGMNPTGAAIQFSKDWQDPRDKETRKINC